MSRLATAGRLFLLLASLAIAGFVAVAGFQFSRLDAPFDVELDGPTGYTLRHSFERGQEVVFYLHAPEETEVTLFRLSEHLEQIDYKHRLGPLEQSPRYSPIKGFSWEPSLRIDSKPLRSGYYYLRLEDRSGRTFNVPFIVRPLEPARVAVIASTNTWDAYNPFAGKSNYVDTMTPWIPRKVFKFAHIVQIQLIGKTQDTEPEVVLPYARPYVEVYATRTPRGGWRLRAQIDGVTDPLEPTFDHLMRAEWFLISFLEHHGIAYGVYSDPDFESNYAIHEADVVIFHVHSEYWSREMLGKLSQYLEAGGKVMFLSGNNAYREVIHMAGHMDVISQQLDPSVVAPILGTFTNAIDTWAPYQVADASHWVFEGTGVENGTLFGEYSANGALGAAGHECDSIGPWSTGFRTLAVGLNPSGPGHMGIRETAAGWLFNASCITFTGALQHDSTMDRIVLNLLDDALGD